MQKKTKAKSTASTKKASIHRVRRGETLGLIAARYGVSEANLKAWNKDKIQGENTIFYNSRLRLYPPNNDKGSAKAKSNDVKSSAKYYKVRSGDNFWTIARKFGISTKQLERKNPGVNPERLQIGQKIRIQ